MCERLAEQPDELNAALDRVQSSPLAQRFIDFAYCRRIASALVGPARGTASHGSANMLLTGLGYALFLSSVDRGEPRLLPESTVRARQPLAMGHA